MRQNSPEELKFRVTARRDKLFVGRVSGQLQLPEHEAGELTAAALAVQDGSGHDADLLGLATKVLIGHWHRDEAFVDLALDDGDPHLRSVADVTGYHVHAHDGDIGHVEDLLAESSGWGIHYVIIDTKNWWFGKHVLISPYAVKSIDWFNRQSGLDINRDKVKSSPPWDPANKVDQAYERRL